MKAYLAIGVGVLALLGLFGVTIAEMQTSQEQNTPQNELVDNADQREDSVDAVEGHGDGEAATMAEQGAAQQQDAVQQVLGDSGNAATTRLTRSTGSHFDHTTPRRARGLYIRPDGMTVARVNYVDRNTLSLVPVANARVSFIQHRRIVAQALTDERGVFAVSGLTPWGVYSVTAASMDWVCMFSAVIRPYDHSNDHPHRSPDALPTYEPLPSIGATFGRINEIRFVSTNLADDDDSDEQLTPSAAAVAASQNRRAQDSDGTVDDFLDYEFHEFQLIPREDLVAALRAGLFGTDVSGLPAGSVACPGGGGGGGGGGGSGGMVGGGLFGFGGGGGLGAVGSGVAGAVGGAGGSSGTQMGSSFVP
jgi:hypothetical protein